MVRILFGYIDGLLIVVISVLIIVFFCENITQEKVISECLGELYNIPNYKIYDEILEDLRNFETIEELSQFVLFDYDKYCTKTGINKIVSNRTHMFYRKAAYNKQFTMKLKDITLEKSFQFKDQQRIGYNYIVMLIIDYVNTDKVETVYEKGYLTVVKVNKDWKIDSLQSKTCSEVFK